MASPQSTPIAEILSQGDEVVTGQVADTNAAWLATRLTDLGFTVVRHTSVGDRLGDLVALFNEVGHRCDLAVCTGGLGPTEDDLTAEAIATAYDRPLVLDEHALEDLKAKYARFHRPMPAVNEKQCWLPTGCTRLDNDWGTAPGFAVQAERAWMAFMPGVPREMRNLFDQRIVPHLLERFDLSPGRLVTLRTTGVGESNLQERINSGPAGRWVDAHPNAVISFRTKLPENHVKLRLDPSLSDAEAADLVEELVGLIGKPVFAIEGLPEAVTTGRFSALDLQGGELVQVIGRRLASLGHTLACAESCTGGRVGAMCTAHGGSSTWFTEGAITYSNAAKVRMLGVDPDVLEQHGAVSEPVARQMAEGIRERAGTTWGVSTTGIAGPGGATDGKPVGTVHIAVAGPIGHDGQVGTSHKLLRLGGDRSRIQTLAASSVLDLLRRTL